jgi:hypothetical protein
MTNSRNSPEVNSRPIALADGAEFYLAPGISCPHCGVALRGFDAEPLRPGVRLLCKNHHLVLSFEPAPR